jgi:hypothetical protein
LLILGQYNCNFVQYFENNDEPIQKFRLEKLLNT